MEYSKEKPFWIRHNTEVKLSFINRLRVLFNGHVRTESTIYVDKEVEIVKTECGTITDEIFPKRRKPIGLWHFPDAVSDVATN